MDNAPIWPRLTAPSVSIVICNHNHGRYLHEAVTSALTQRPMCQVIVVDDGSTDESRDVLARLDSRRLEIVLQDNGGQGAAYNAGFVRSRGDVVLFLDADDALLPHAARAMAVLFERGVVKVHCRMDMVDERGEELGVTVPSTLARGEVGAALQRHGLLYPSAPGSGNAYRRAALAYLFPIPVSAEDKVGADFFTIYGSGVLGAVAACDTPLVRYRIHRQADAVATDRETRAGLVFGNAAQGNSEASKVVARFRRLSAHLVQRGLPTLPSRVMDFSVQKTPFAVGVLSQPYWRALLRGGPGLLELLKSLWLQPANSMKRKLALSGWALLVMASPRCLALPVARFVCNPAHRART